ncbi:MAG TPA: hypothetical protein VHY84_05660 [Bryobacteraceae bacterium]|jgi:hypothetical protein|nr:hypothetical protein [Bryobacteraceae bacterium]
MKAMVWREAHKWWIGMAGFVLLSPALFAQWPSHVTAGEPRTADGKVNMSAPTPKAPDGHPDLSGVWDRGTVPGVSMQSTVQPGGFGSTPPPGPRPFQDLPSLFPDGLPLQPWAAELRKQRFAENSKGHPDAHCLPLHPVQLHSHPQPRKIMQTSGEVVIVYEANDGLRQIFTDGRPLPVDPEPWWFGYSVGKWDGDTLVVDTIGFRDMMWIDEQGTPITTSGRIHERFRRVNYGTLEIEVTVDDPRTFTKPWTFKLNQRLMPDTELIEFVCAENNRSLPHLVGK